MKLTKQYIKQLVLETLQKEAVDPSVRAKIEAEVKAALTAKGITGQESEIKNALTWYFSTTKITDPTTIGATNFVIGWLGKDGLST